MANAAYSRQVVGIWFQENNPQIPRRSLDIIQDSSNIVLFSQISLFELAIKQKIGKIPDFKATIEEIYNQSLKDSFTFLSIQNAHITNYKNIPLLEDHRDPFDRLLLATALTEKAVIISADEKFRLYHKEIEIMWE